MLQKYFMYASSLQVCFWFGPSMVQAVDLLVDLVVDLMMDVMVMLGVRFGESRRGWVGMIKFG